LLYDRSSLPRLYLLSFHTRRSSDLNVINGNSISTITRKSTDRRYSLTFKSYGVKGQNGSTVPDSAFINEKITFPLLLQGHIQNRSEEHTSELQSRFDIVCRLLLDTT